MGKKNKNKGKSNGNGTTKEAPKLAAKFFSEVEKIDGVKVNPVSNGDGLWVKTTRVLKSAKSGFPANALLFPSSTTIHGMVTSKKLSGTITDKNVAVVQVTPKNYGRLMDGMKASITAVKTKQAERKKKKTEAKKAETGKKTTGKKAKRAEAAKKVQAEKKSTEKSAPTPTPETVSKPAEAPAAAASAMTEMLSE